MELNGFNHTVSQIHLRYCVADLLTNLKAAVLTGGKSCVARKLLVLNTS